MNVFRSMLLRLAPLLIAVLPYPVLAKPPVVLAAASLQESLTAAADGWVARGHERPVISFAASSALARQVEAGAPADLFISADKEWMDYLAKRGLVRQFTRRSLLTNRLVLIVPRTASYASQSPPVLLLPRRWATAAWRWRTPMRFPPVAMVRPH